MAAVSSRKKRRIEKEAVQIPEDVSVGILKRLPLKSLVRFRCACKTWYSVISDPEFYNKLRQKRAHVLICRKPKSCCSLTPESCNKLHDPDRLVCGRPYTVSTVTIEESSLMKEKTVALPWQPEPERGSKTTFLGSCNGLVCVYHTSPCPDRSGLYLWNPPTRKFRRLPPAPRIRNLFDVSTYTGFGYEESAGDYKFVWMVIKPERIQFDVFSLKSKTWSSFYHRPPSTIILSGTGFRREQHGVLSNGAIHWNICDQDRLKGGKRIFAFDLASERYRLLEFPQRCGWNCKIVSLSGFLCCLYTGDNKVGGSSIDLWMMKEYGVVSSWRKLVSLLPTTFSGEAISLYRYHPIHFSSEEGNLVAIVNQYEGCEIMRWQVKKKEIVSSETLLIGTTLSQKGYEVEGIIVLEGRYHCLGGDFSIP